MGLVVVVVVVVVVVGVDEVQERETAAIVETWFGSQPLPGRVWPATFSFWYLLHWRTAPGGSFGNNQSIHFYISRA